MGGKGGPQLAEGNTIPLLTTELPGPAQPGISPSTFPTSQIKRAFKNAAVIFYLRTFSSWAPASVVFSSRLKQ